MVSNAVLSSPPVGEVARRGHLLVGAVIGEPHPVPEQDEAIRVRVGKGLEQHREDDRDDRGARADAERQCQAATVVEPRLLASARRP
jgi:hypothetical protein